MTPRSGAIVVLLVIQAIVLGAYMLWVFAPKSPELSAALATGAARLVAVFGARTEAAVDVDAPPAAPVRGDGVLAPAAPRSDPLRNARAQIRERLRRHTDLLTVQRFLQVFREEAEEQEARARLTELIQTSEDIPALEVFLQRTDSAFDAFLAERRIEYLKKRQTPGEDAVSPPLPSRAPGRG